MSNKIILSLILGVLLVSFISAGFWDWVTGDVQKTAKLGGANLETSISRTNSDNGITPGAKTMMGDQEFIITSSGKTGASGRVNFRMQGPDGTTYSCMQQNARPFAPRA